MNINVNPQTLTAFAKSMVGLIAAAVVVWNTPASHDAIAPMLANHPHAVSLIVAGVAVWNVLHNPIKPAA